MSTGFSGSTTRSLNGLQKEVESRLAGKSNKKLDVFTDDFNPPGTAESFPGSNFDKSKNGYQKPHDDTSSKDSTSALAAAGDAKDQPKLDEVDRIANMFEVGIKQPKDQFPGAKKMTSAQRLAKYEKQFSHAKMLEKLSGGVDEALWQKAKDASQEAFGKIKWPFVNWWYTEHGGK